MGDKETGCDEHYYADEQCGEVEQEDKGHVDLHRHHVHIVGLGEEVYGAYSAWLSRYVDIPRYTLKDIEQMLPLMHQDKKRRSAAPPFFVGEGPQVLALPNKEC